MDKFSASKAGHEGDTDKDTDRTPQGRRPIFVESPPAHAGIVASLRTAFAMGSCVPDNDDANNDEFSALLKRLN